MRDEILFDGRVQPVDSGRLSKLNVQVYQHVCWPQLEREHVFQPRDVGVGPDDRLDIRLHSQGRLSPISKLRLSIARMDATAINKSPITMDATASR